jgi:hypothetical protein
MFPIENAESISDVADWVELEIATSQRSMSRARLQSIGNGAAGMEFEEAFVAGVWDELTRRAGRYQRAYYRFIDSSIEPIDDGQPKFAYLFCLVLSLYGVPAAHRAAPKLLERMCGEALRRYLSGRKIIFGWPLLPELPAAIGERVKYVADELGERYVESPAGRYKDRGVDVIAWSPFTEPRSNKIVILAQCAAGGNWRSKTRELPLESWKEYIHWAGPVSTAFGLPCVVPDDLWHDVSKEAGLVLDRIRLLNLLPHGALDAGLVTDLTDWTNGALATLAA